MVNELDEHLDDIRIPAVVDSVPSESNRGVTRSKRPVSKNLNEPNKQRSVTKDVRISALFKRWEFCITQVTLDENLEISIYKQLASCNTLVGSTRRHLSNYECVYLFSQLVLKHKDDEEFVKSFFILVLRFWFCWKYGIHLSQFPYLGCVNFLYNLILGSRIIYAFNYRYLLLFFDVHDNIKGIIEPILVYKYVSNSEGIDSFNHRLLVNLSNLTKDFIGGGDICVEYMNFVAQFVNADYRIAHVPDVLDDGFSLNLLWEGIMESLSKSRVSNCYCQVLQSSILFDVYARRLVVETNDLQYNHWRNCMSYFGNWIASNDVVLMKELANILKINSSVVTMIKKCMKDIPINFSTIKSESLNPGSVTDHHLRNLSIIWSFGLLFRHYMSVNEILPEPLLLICAAVTKLESKLSLNPVDIYNDLKVLKNGGNTEVLLSSILRMSEYGRGILKLLDMVNYYQCEDFKCEGLVGVCGCYYNIFMEMLNACSIHADDLNNLHFALSLSTDNNLNSDESFAVFNLSQDMAKHLLEPLVLMLHNRKTTVGNISIDSESLPDGIRGCKFVKRTSVTIITSIALASLMNDLVYILKNGTVLKVLIQFTSTIFVPLIDNWQLLLSLLYLDIANDATLALEYNNPQLTVYRTLLIRYLLQVSLLPIHFVHRIYLRFDDLLDFDAFIIRVLRLLNFRINYHLMDEAHFVKFLTTRVVYEDDIMDRGNKLSEGNLQDERDGGCVNGYQAVDKNGNDSIYRPLHSFSNDITVEDRAVFGLIEHLVDFKVDLNLIFRIKCEGGSLISSSSTNTSSTSIEYFLNVLYELFGVLRFCVNRRRVYQNEKLDHYILRFFLRVCCQHCEFMEKFDRDEYETHIKNIYKTNENGELLKYTDLLGSFGLDNNGMINFINVVDNRTHTNTVVATGRIAESLSLSNTRFSRSLFYKIASYIVFGVIKWSQFSCIPNIISTWASQLPNDCTSCVRAEKISTARSLVISSVLKFIDILGKGPPDLHDHLDLEPLLSAINIIYVNIELLHKNKTLGGCEDGDEGKHASIDDVQVKYERVDEESDVYNHTQETVSINEGVLALWKKKQQLHQMRARERKELLRIRRIHEGMSLLKSSVLFVHILSELVSSYNYLISNSTEGFITIEDGCYLLSCLGKKRGLFNNSLSLFALAYNTINNVIRACLDLSFHTIDHEVDTNDGEMIDFMNEINAKKKGIKDVLDVLNSIKRGPEITPDMPLNDELFLDDFIDFETDEHLDMVTYTDITKKFTKNTRAKLRMVQLRNEWKCLIKSYLT